MKVLDLGSLNIDHVYSVEHFVRPGETLAATRVENFCGGKGLNQAIALARAGAQVYMAGKPVKYKAKHLPKIDAELDGIMDGLDNDPFVSEWKIAEEKKSLNPFAKRGTKE